MMQDWNNTDLIFRQVHPNHWDGQNPNSVAFSPTPKDDDKLSVDDGAQVTAEASWIFFTKNLGFQSAGTWAVTAGEIQSIGDLKLQRDSLISPENPTKNNLAHCLIDFSGLTSKGQRKKRAQELAIKASERGCQFQAPV